MTNHAVSNRVDLRERTKTMSRHGDSRGQIADFRDSFETINWLYLLFKCGIKTKTHFEWLLWHWSSLGQLNLEPTRPNGLVGCKVPTDLVKISVKEATHMGFHYIFQFFLLNDFYILILIKFHWNLFPVKVAEDDIALKLAILKKSLHLNDNTCFCSIIQSSKLVLGSLLAKNNFFVQFWTKTFASSQMANCGSGLPAEWPFRSQNAIEASDWPLPGGLWVKRLITHALCSLAYSDIAWS